MKPEELENLIITAVDGAIDENNLKPLIDCILQLYRDLQETKLENLQLREAIRTTQPAWKQPPNLMDERVYKPIQVDPNFWQSNGEVLGKIITSDKTNGSVKVSAIDGGTESVMGYFDSGHIDYGSLHLDDEILNSIGTAFGLTRKDVQDDKHG